MLNYNEVKMEITLKIKNIGQTVGTVGDLLKGLTNGIYRFEERRTKTGKIGLWIASDDKSQCLAIYNPYDLDSLSSGHDPFKFYRSQSVDEDDRRHCWTESAWQSILIVTDQWIADRNFEIDNEKISNINVLRVTN